MMLKTEWYNTGTKESNSVEVHKAPRRRRRHRRRRRRQHHHHHRHRHHLITTCTRLSYESRTLALDGRVACRLGAFLSRSTSV